MAAGLSRYKTFADTNVLPAADLNGVQDTVITWADARFAITGLLTTAAALTFAGAYASTLTFTAATTVTFPTSGTLLSTATAVTAAQGGTGQTTYTKGDLLVASAATTLSKLAVGTNDYVLVADSTQSTGLRWAVATSVGAVSSVFGRTGAVVAVAGDYGPTLGGTGQTTYTLGDLLYSSASNTLAKLAGNTTTTRKFLHQTGTGAVSAAPTWDTVTKTDVGLANVENTALSTWAGSANITTLGTVGTGTWQGTAVGIAYGGTGATTAANAAENLGLGVTDSPTFAGLSLNGLATFGDEVILAANKLLRFNGAGNAPYISYNGSQLLFDVPAGKAYYFATGSVGIGAAPANSLFHIQGTIDPNTTIGSRYENTILANNAVNMIGAYHTNALTVSNGIAAARAAQVWINGITATLTGSGTLANHNALYLGVPVNGTVVRIIDTGVAGCFLTTGGTWTDASHEFMPDGVTPWKLRKTAPEGWDVLDILRKIEVTHYDLTDSEFTETTHVNDPKTGKIKLVNKKWQVAEHDRRNHFGVLAENLRDVSGGILSDGVGVNGTRLASFAIAAAQKLDRRLTALEARLKLE